MARDLPFRAPMMDRPAMRHAATRRSGRVRLACLCLAFLVGCGGNGDSGKDPLGMLGEPAADDVSRETALGWPERFCRLRVGMTRREVREVMGSPPTQEFLTGDGAQDQWHAYQFNITIFFEDRAQVTDPLDQRARQLEPDSTGELTPEDEALFPCGSETVFQTEAEVEQPQVDATGFDFDVDCVAAAKSYNAVVSFKATGEGYGVWSAEREQKAVQLHEKTVRESFVKDANFDQNCVAAYRAKLEAQGFSSTAAEQMADQLQKAM